MCVCVCVCGGGGGGGLLHGASFQHDQVFFAMIFKRVMSGLTSLTKCGIIDKVCLKSLFVCI